MSAASNFTTPRTNECILTDEEINYSYNLTHRIISIFVLLIVSFVGAAISVVSTRVKRLHINPIIINTGKFFGSGVVLATGFIHMLPPGMKSLTDPCLPDSWNVYSAYGGLFAMLAALIMQLIEFIAHQRYQSMKSSKPYPINEGSKIKDQKPVQISVVEIIPSTEELCDSTHHYHGAAFQDDIQKHKISTYLLEFGIALHSVLIGLTLGTTTESFIALFIALSFHQFFEAIALGAQIARLDRISLRSTGMMVIFFALTTPVGIAIGIGIHTKTYNPKSIASLLVNGILDSISAGILIYVALVNLITAEMGVGAHAFHTLKKRLKLLYFIALYAGVGAMSVVGRWA
ncbi:unnamed protein product [Adineta steineri]|uniref:Uncharacterized protein n=1 Tax=Adineta steineri TaxID=433720 RepID=A0A818SYS7_9BILA|nr:unnamed protein product [Adineta steineri]CAF1284420.1 unnamed protein product [Adineta steineri]CAF3633635.1 unnamed protein product [Adineta steineri]CAF3676724.1 unnamed protein product [Adineta steineri]